MHSQQPLTQTLLKCFCCHQQLISRICLNEQSIEKELYLLCNSCCKKNDQIRMYRTQIYSLQSDLFPISLFSINAFQKQSMISVPECIQKCRVIAQNKFNSLFQTFQKAFQSSFWPLNLIQSTLNCQTSENLETIFKNPTNKKYVKNNLNTLKWLIQNKQNISNTELINQKINKLLEKFENDFSNEMNKIQKSIKNLFESIGCQRMFQSLKQQNEKPNQSQQMDAEQQQYEKVVNQVENNLADRRNEQKNNFKDNQPYLRRIRRRTPQNRRGRPARSRSLFFKEKIVPDQSPQEILQNQRKQQQLLKQNQLQSLQTLQSIKKSSILKFNDTSLLRLMKFFNRKIKKLDVVFKASQNDFCMKKYFQQCGYLTDTIILCKTSKGKVIGGYSPLKFNPTNLNFDDQFQRIHDELGTSFVFSLSQNQKFELNKQRYAIRRYQNMSRIQFGKGFLQISQGSTQKFFLKIKLTDDSYYNSEYLQFFNKQVTNKEITSIRSKFTGSTAIWIYLKELQVIKVQFQ